MTTDYGEALHSDLAEQFKERPNIRALLNAIGRQMDEIYQFFCDLRDLRGVMTAEGAQLDGVGDIVKLTRSEAGELACVTESTYVLDDDRYRDFLIYKIWRNTNTTTYYDIIKSMRIFWTRPLYYSEDPEIPACMLFDTGDMEGFVDTRKLMLNPIIRAAGVGYRLRAATSTKMPPSTLYIKDGFWTLSNDQLPFIERDIDYSMSVHVLSNYMSITGDHLPFIERDIDYTAEAPIISNHTEITESTVPGSGQATIMETQIGEATTQ